MTPRTRTRPVGALRFAFVGGIIYAALAAIGTLVAISRALASSTTQLSMPVKPFWPELLPSVRITDGPTAEVVGGGFEWAEVAVTGLTLDVKLLLASGHLLQGATQVIIGIAIAVLGSRVLRGSPFGPTLSRSVSITAIAIAVGGLGWQLCFGLGGIAASTQVLTVTSWQSDSRFVPGGDTRRTGLPEPWGGFDIAFWPLLLAVALVSVAAAFRYGERLQSDTERLRRDTEGLV